MIGFRRRKRRANVKDECDYIVIRMYDRSGNLIVGPLSLTELGMMIVYGGWRGVGERSIIHITGAGSVMGAGPFDVTAEWSDHK